MFATELPSCREQHRLRRAHVVESLQACLATASEGASQAPAGVSLSSLLASLEPQRVPLLACFRLFLCAAQPLTAEVVRRSKIARQAAARRLQG